MPREQPTSRGNTFNERSVIRVNALVMHVLLQKYTAINQELRQHVKLGTQIRNPAEIAVQLSGFEDQRLLKAVTNTRNTQLAKNYYK